MIARETRREEEQDIAEEEDGEGGLDVQTIKDILGFVWRSPRRHPLLATSLFVVVAGLGMAIAATMPRIYNVSVKLFAQKTSVLPEAGTIRGAREEDYPMRNVSDVIRQHDNLVDLVERTNLVEKFYARRSPALRLKDRIMTSLGSQPTADDKEAGVLSTLDKKLVVTADDDSVTISVDWFDPQSTFDVAAEVEHNLLEARYDSQVAMIQEAINLLEQHQKSKLDQVDDALADYDAQREKLAPAAAAPVDSSIPVTVATARGTVVRRQSAPGAAPVADPDIAHDLEAKRQRIRFLEDEHQHQVDAVREQLRVALLTLTPLHPTVMALQRSLADLNEPPAELTQLKSDEKKLMAEIIPPSPAPSAPLSVLGAFAPGGAATAAAPSQPAAAPTTVRTLAMAEADNPVLARARQRLESAIHDYQDATSRVDGAQLELEFARRACRYRYRVITPPEVPRGTKKPMSTMIGVGSFFAGLLLALLGSAGADLSTGVLLETWQVRRQLKLEVLTEIDPPVGLL
jgi:uncharacterized protein involved in exopolysaccharide biosynthesis